MSAGIVMMKKTGDYVEKDEIIAVLYTNRKEKTQEAAEAYLCALTFGDEKPMREALIYEIL